MDGELHIRLLHAGLFQIDQSWNAQNVYSSYWRFYINKCDGAELELPYGRFAIRGNRIYFIPAWVRFSCHNVRCLQHFYVHFDVVGLSDHVARKIFNRPLLLSGKYDFDTFTHNLKFDTPDPWDHPSCLCRVKSAVYKCFADMLDQLRTEEKAELSRSLAARNRFGFTLQYIENHLAQDLDNKDLARVSHMSESYFSHCFKDLIGQTPARYVLERRIASAARQLAFSDASIEQVSESAGFANRFHFSRNFRRLMGVTPAVYRKTTRV